MRILGIDPGIALVGYGVVDSEGSRVLAVEYGKIQTPAKLEVAGRLQMIYEAVKALLGTYQPDSMSVEQLFFNRNVTTAFTVGQARGVILLSAVQQSVPVYEYTPLEVKQAVAGYGYAEKQQVQEMVKRLLHLEKVPRPDDVADALAVALCHAFSLPFLRRVKRGHST